MYLNGLGTFQGMIGLHRAAQADEQRADDEEKLAVGANSLSTSTGNGVNFPISMKRAQAQDMTKVLYV